MEFHSSVSPLVAKSSEKLLSPFAKVFVPLHLRQEASPSAFPGSPEEDGASSTDAGEDITPTYIDFNDFVSSDSEVSCIEEDNTPLSPRLKTVALTTTVYSIMMLLRMRASVDEEENLDGVRYSTKAVSDCPAPAKPAATTPKVRTFSCDETSWRLALPVSSGDSWVSAQQNRKPEEDEAMIRAARSILNKLTIEKFDSLFAQLTTCGIKHPNHISILMREVFEKATTQHHFIPMYAELCVQLEKDPQIVAAVEEGIDTFRRLLLNECQKVFEQVLEPPSDDDKDDKEAAFRRKQQALGNMKLIGQLLVNGMLQENLFAECSEQLLRKHAQCPEALEALVALMMVACPKFDRSPWQYYNRLQNILGDMGDLTKNKAVAPRLRFLIRDVLDARAAGWPNCPSGGKSVGMSPSKLDEVKKQAETSSPPSSPVNKEEQSLLLSYVTAKGGQEKLMKAAPWKSKKQSVSFDTAPEIVAAPPAGFQVVAFRRELNAIFSDLASDRNIPGAVQRIRLQAVPACEQAEQYVDILTRIVEERRGAVRRCELAFIAGFAAAESSAFERKECLVGIEQFFKEVYPELCNEVHRLPAIMKSEFMPTMMNVFPAADLNKVVPQSMKK